MAQTFISSFATALYRAASGKSKPEIDALTGRAAALFASKRMVKKSPLLFEALENVRLHDEKKMKAVVTSKHPLTAAELKGIAEHMQQIMKKEIEIESIVDPKLLGGFKVRCGDTVLDATLDHSVKQLAHHLTTKE
jgi:F-type H+-transporting ATPase subunit delta